jgi:phosphoribosylformimino-5-aminoimidazole carboxamide ribotide isomerase
MELIPAIDLRGGHVVRLLHGDFAAETRYEVTPRDLYERYADFGAAQLHVVDLDGARGGTQENRAAILALAGLGRLRMQVGGGLRSQEAVAALLDGGVSRAVIGSLAVTSPDLVNDWFRQYGADRLTLAFDVRLGADGAPRIATHGWQQQSSLTLWEAVDRYLASGLRHVLCTDVGRDGAMTGPNLALYREAVERCPTIAWQASGGVRDARDLADLAAVGVAGTVSGRALLEGTLQRQEIEPFLPAA